MALSWSSRRKLIYSTASILVALVVIWGIWQTFFTTPPTCFDGKQDGNEQGIDCGGSCSLLCPNQVQTPVVLWARAFQTGPNTYTAAAYIQNTNAGAGAKNASYSLQLFDANNQLVIEDRGTIDLPPIETIPIVIPNIDVGNRTVSHTLFTLTNTPTWNKVVAGTIPHLYIQGQVLAPDGSRLTAMVVNNSQKDAGPFTVAAVLFDTQGTAQAASKSFLPGLAHQSQQQVVFTWSGGIPNIVRAEITVLPSF